MRAIERNKISFSQLLIHSSYAEINTWPTMIRKILMMLEKGRVFKIIEANKSNEVNDIFPQRFFHLQKKHVKLLVHIKYL